MLESRREQDGKSSDSTCKMERKEIPLANKSKPQAQRLAQFYEGKHVLITGVTGFIGKVCLIKLMSSLGNCGQVYVLLRAKKGMTPQQRFQRMLKEAPLNADLLMQDNETNTDFYKREAVEKIRQIDWSKVSAIDGDMSNQDLGLEGDLKQLLCQKINIVFNIAASVQFTAPLKDNWRDNYLGASNMLSLCMKFQNLLSLVHVSTFYTNWHISHVEERVVPLSCDCEKLSELIGWLPGETLEKIAPELMEKRPNTYVLTKAMAENLVKKYEGRLPVAIVRPSIVLPSKSEPEPGWVDNVNGPMGVGILAAIGVLRNIDWNYWGVSDFVPVDQVANSMLAVAERTARLHPKEIKVYNCSSSSLNPATWGQSFETLRRASVEVPSIKMLRVPIAVPKHREANKTTFALSKLNELFFAYFIDFLLILCGQKRLLLRLTAKLQNAYEILSPFTKYQYTCDNDNLLAAFGELSDEDKIEFDFNIGHLQWDEYFRNAFLGSRKRLLKEDLSNVSTAKLKMRVLRVVEFLFRLAFIGLLGWVALKVLGPINSPFKAIYSGQSLIGVAAQQQAAHGVLSS